MSAQPPLKRAPQEIFNRICEYAVIPTFDLVLSYRGGVIMARRKIAPYKGVWALPGLRIMKPESIDDCLKRIALAELGLQIDPARRVFLGQYVSKFRTEHGRQDLSTGYHVPVEDSAEIRLNGEHFTSCQVVRQTPPGTGAMYRFYLDSYFAAAEPQ